MMKTIASSILVFILLSQVNASAQTEEIIHIDGILNDLGPQEIITDFKEVLFADTILNNYAISTPLPEILEYSDYKKRMKAQSIVVNAREAVVYKGSDQKYLMTYGAEPCIGVLIYNSNKESALMHIPGNIDDLDLLKRTLEILTKSNPQEIYAYIFGGLEEDTVSVVAAARILGHLENSHVTLVGHNMLGKDFTQNPLKVISIVFDTKLQKIYDLKIHP